MELPENAVGPTDIQQYRDCPRRFEFGLRRHTDAGEHPEAQGPDTAYGSAIHEAIAYVEANDATDEEAVQRAFDLYAKWLDPEDLERMRGDLATYHARDYLGVRTVAVERELRIPLFEHMGQTIYLRTRIDRLYQRLDNPGVFIHVDYKSSRWARSEPEIHNDRQLWITNLIVHEFFPECERLVQVYDQLLHGPITTRKSDEQRDLIRDWLIKQITAILNDTELAPKHNDWCAWCPIMESCPVVAELSDFALARIAALAPAEKEGRKTVLRLDPDRLDVYVDQLEPVGEALKVLKRFNERVRDVVRELPSTRRRQLGYRVSERMSTSWPPEALRAAHELLGDDFYEVVGVTKTAVERLGDERSEAVLGMAVTEHGAPVVVREKGG